MNAVFHKQNLLKVFATLLWEKSKVAYTEIFFRNIKQRSQKIDVNIKRMEIKKLHSSLSTEGLIFRFADFGNS